MQIFTFWPGLNYFLRAIYPKQSKLSAGDTESVVSMWLPMLPDELKLIKTGLNAPTARFGVSRLRVFGSVAKGQESAEDDVDFLVVIPAG